MEYYIKICTLLVCNDLHIIDQVSFTDYIERLLKNDLPKKLTGHPDQPKLPLVRIRVEYEDETHQLAVGRFGNNFYDKVANPAEILLFKKIKKNVRDVSKLGITLDNGTQQSQGDVVHQASIEDLIKEHFLGKKTQKLVKNVTKLPAKC